MQPGVDHAYGKFLFMRPAAIPSGAGAPAFAEAGLAQRNLVVIADRTATGE